MKRAEISDNKLAVSSKETIENVKHIVENAIQIVSINVYLLGFKNALLKWPLF